MAKVKRAQTMAAESKSKARKTELPDFERSLPMALLQAREAVMNRFRPVLRENGVTEQQWRVLRTLDAARREDGAKSLGMEAGELARRSVLLTPSLTRIIKNLEKAGLITRRNDPEDLRRIRLAITAKGRKLIARVAPHSEAQYADITAKLGAANLERLYHQLATITARLQP
jgi:homoprotocatechuate degradation regulator HpaR